MGEKRKRSAPKKATKALVRILIQLFCDILAYFKLLLFTINAFASSRSLHSGYSFTQDIVVQNLQHVQKN
ncbi:hypothetical protein BpHYR1_025412 [Brachionus plicatilis]|uniref:Uncharacterized protein n=1 Tax=Brachionus plicatilis TaxID=10195 RepID=A0A3M7Q9X4_BRAPC|nr:hypothetical protein BpHYR1_025412 [Brachionus plicatilis]